MSETHGDHCREVRVAQHGALLAQVALSMVRGVRCADADETIEEYSEAKEYLVDALVQMVVDEEDPRLAIEDIVRRLDSYPIEELTRRLDEVRQQLRK